MKLSCRSGGGCHGKEGGGTSEGLSLGEVKEREKGMKWRRSGIYRFLDL